MKTFSALLLCFLFTACARPTVRVYHWTKNGATQQQFMTDRYECMKESRKSVYGGYANRYAAASSGNEVTDFGMFTGCMTAKGYMPDEEGNLYPPPGVVAPMY